MPNDVSSNSLGLTPPNATLLLLRNVLNFILFKNSYIEQIIYKQSLLLMLLSLMKVQHEICNIMYTVYHNPRCKKSRAGLQYVQEHTNDFEVIEYLKTPINESVLKDLLMKLNQKPLDMVRPQEAIYKSDFKGKNFTDDEWVKIMIENPKLIKRPIVVRGNKAIWGDPAENLSVLF